MTLLDLNEGEKGIITKVRGRGAFRKRIMEMGFIKGKTVIVGKKAPLKNPIEYTVMGYNVSLRNSEADLIEVVHESQSREPEYKNGNGVWMDSEVRHSVRSGSKEINVALVGNPNCGKTTLFNYATRSHEKVGNYGGVTVDAKKVRIKRNGYTYNLIDLPGTYSLTYYSPEELFVRSYLFDEIPDVVVNVIDSSNLERNLYLTTQLIDLDIKLVIALNMYDELTLKGDNFDYEALGKMIGIPMVPTVSSKGKGINQLFKTINEVFEDQDPTVRHIHINYGEDIEKAIVNIREKLCIEENRKLTNVISPRFLAIKLLESDRQEQKRILSCVNYNDIIETVKEEKQFVEENITDSAESFITDYKYGFINGALKETYIPSRKDIRVFSKAIDKILTNRYLSYPVFIFLIWFMFQATFNIGEYPKQWIESLVVILGDSVNSILPAGIIRDLIVDGIIDGVGGVIVFFAKYTDSVFLYFPDGGYWLYGTGSLYCG